MSSEGSDETTDELAPRLLPRGTRAALLDRCSDANRAPSPSTSSKRIGGGAHLPPLLPIPQDQRDPRSCR
jgi:hypothetical protein